VAQIYRLFGHELEIREEKTELLHQLFAPVQECIIYPTNLLHATRETDKLKLVCSMQRPGRSTTIPDVSALSAGQTIQADYTTPRLSMTHFNKRVLPIAPAMVLPQRTRDIKFRVKGSTVLHKVKMSAGDHKPVRQDFQRDVTQVAPLLPILRADRVNMQVRTTDDEDLPADVAE